MGISSRWKAFAPAATRHAALRSTIVSDLSASPLALGSASVGWAGFDVPRGNDSRYTEMSPVQTSTREGHPSQGIRTLPGEGLELGGWGWNRVVPSCLYAGKMMPEHPASAAHSFRRSERSNQCRRRELSVMLSAAIPQPGSATGSCRPRRTCLLLFSRALMVITGHSPHVSILSKEKNWLGF